MDNNRLVTLASMNRDEQIRVCYASEAIWGAPPVNIKAEVIGDAVELEWLGLLNVSCRVEIGEKVAVVKLAQTTTEIPITPICNLHQETQKSENSIFWIDKKHINVKLLKAFPDIKKLMGETNMLQLDMRGRKAYVFNGRSFSEVYKTMMTLRKLKGSVAIEVIPELWENLQAPIALTMKNEVYPL